MSFGVYFFPTLNHNDSFRLYGIFVEQHQMNLI